MKRAAAVVVLFMLGIGGQFALNATRPVDSPMAAEGALAAIGGFRSLAAEVVWFRADRLQREGRYVELAQLASTLTFLEPHTPEVWSFAAWNLAYNVSVMMPTEADRWRWVLASLKLLRDEGLALNPSEPELYREIAWLFEIKIGGGLDTAAPLYRARWREIVEDVRARGAWKELGMDPGTMAEIEREYGFSDWTDPLLSAVYWARLGLAAATEKLDRAFLSEIMKQSLTILSRTSKPAPGPRLGPAGAGDAAGKML